MDALTVPVSECFGPVWQGEGPHTGRRCSFLRLGLCNLHCDWCDTPYTWDDTRYDVSAECPPWSASQIVEALDSHRTNLVVLSGGEPVIHSRNLALLEALTITEHEIHVETNGTLIPSQALTNRVAHWTVSPKVNPQGDPEHRRMRYRTLRWFAQQPTAIFKVVCRTAAEVLAAAAMADEIGLPLDRLWIMPEGTDPNTVLEHARQVEDTTAIIGANLTLRQHVLMHGNERRR